MTNPAARLKSERVGTQEDLQLSPSQIRDGLTTAITNVVRSNRSIIGASENFTNPKLVAAAQARFQGSSQREMKQGTNFVLEMQNLPESEQRQVLEDVTSLLRRSDRSYTEVYERMKSQAASQVKG